MPLHAAGIYSKGEEDCCSDYVVSSYTPTLTALLHAQKSAPSLHPRDSGMVLVSAQQPNSRMLPALLNVEEEMRQVAAASEQAGLSVNKDCTPNATVADVIDALKTANFAHIACHGIQDTNNPLSSGFRLSNMRLRVNQLMYLAPKHAFFAFLSACETAKGDKNQPDQMVHLAAAMLFVGFRSVVATMW
jgi:CHAT domain-containing protein